MVQIGFTNPWWDTLRLRAAQSPFTFNIDQGWNWTDVASLALTAVLVLIAGLEIRRAHKAEGATLAARNEAEAAHRKAADTRISFIGYALQRKILEWAIEAPAGIAKAAAANLDLFNWYRAMQGRFTPAEALMSDMMTLAADASEEVRAATRATYVKFYRVTLLVNEACGSTGDQQDVAASKAKEILDEMGMCLRDLVRVLDFDLMAEVLKREKELGWIPPPR